MSNDIHFNSMPLSLVVDDRILDISFRHFLPELSVFGLYAAVSYAASANTPKGKVPPLCIERLATRAVMTKAAVQTVLEDFRTSGLISEDGFVTAVNFGAQASPAETAA